MPKNIQEILQAIDALRESQTRTDAAIKATSVQQKLTDIQLAKTDAQLAKTDAKLDRVAKILGNMGDTNGEIAEDYFYHSLQETPQLGSIKFDTVMDDVRPLGGSGPEFDIVLVNGESVGIVEIKRKAHPEQIEKLANEQTKAFKELYTKYNDHKLYFGVASLVTNESLKQAAKKAGVFLLTQKGNRLELVNESVRVF